MNTPQRPTWPALAPSRPWSAKLVPAHVEVVGVDGDYTDAAALREAASTLLRMAERLDGVR